MLMRLCFKHIGDSCEIKRKDIGLCLEMLKDKSMDLINCVNVCVKWCGEVRNYLRDNLNVRCAMSYW